MSDLGENILALRKRLGMSRAAFAKEIGVNDNKIKHVETGYQRADHVFLAEISSKFDVSVDDLLGLAPRQSQNITSDGDQNSNRPDIVTLPKVDVRASAGPGQPIYSEDEVGRYAVKRSWLDRRGLKPENLSVISVVGDSMVPDLYDEDRIIIDHSQTAIKDSFIYAVRFSGDLFVKRIQRIPDNRALLISKNSDYPPVPVDTDADFQVIGRVVSSMHEW